MDDRDFSTVVIGPSAEVVRQEHEKKVARTRELVRSIDPKTIDRNITRAERAAKKPRKRK